MKRAILLVLVAVAAGAALAGELLAARAAVLSGAACGLALAAVGLFFALRIARRHSQAHNAMAGRADIWGLWGLGMLARLAALAVLSGILWKTLDSNLTTAMIALAIVYIGALFWEAGWLCGLLVADGNGRTHG